MSTAAVSTDVKIPVKSDQFTYVKVQTGTETVDGNAVPVFKVVPEDNEDLKKKLESGEWKEVARQTFKSYSAGSFEGIQELIKDEEEVVAMFNRGISVKQQNKARSILMSDEFETVDGSYDLREALAEPTQRRGLTDTEKAMRVLGKLSPDAVAQVIAALHAANAPSA